MEMVAVKNFDNYFTANILLTRLQGEGIACYLKDEFSATINPVFSNSIGGIKLMVRNDQLDETLALLKEMNEEACKIAHCPRCNKEGLDYIPKISKGNVFTKIVKKFFGSYATMHVYIYHCSNCGWQSESLPQLD
jgi:hypothetical protein